MTNEANTKKETKVLITGVNGFIGKSLFDRLSINQEILVSGAARKSINSDSKKTFQIDDIDADTDWLEPLTGVDVVIHTAGLAHHGRDISEDEYYTVNTEGTINLARQAKDLGVSTFIFISSIAVNGSSSDEPFRNDSPVDPQDAYAKSKCHAEVSLIKDLSSSRFKVYVIRPPLVYGKDAPGNFGQLVSLVQKPLPLPFAGIDNKRSFIFIENLLDVLEQLTLANNIKQGVYLVSDGDDVSTSEFMRLILDESQGRAMLFKFPLRLLRLSLMLIGKHRLVDKLAVNLQVDSSETAKALGWIPRYKVADALKDIFSK